MAELRQFADPKVLSATLADEILTAYASRTNERFLLGCPAGRSLHRTYRALAARAVDLSGLVVVMMDEFVAGGALIPSSMHCSCRGFALREIAAPLGLAEDRVWHPEPADPAAYDERIAEAGGIDLFLVASGASDGHVAFLPPGSPRHGRTSLLEIADTTRRDNVATFPEFGTLEDVPSHGVSVGVATILAARQLRLVLHGAEKREATRRVLACDQFDPSWPASLVHAHPDAEILVDRAALGLANTAECAAQVAGR